MAPSASSKGDPFASNDSIDQLMHRMRQDNQNLIDKVETRRRRRNHQEGDSQQQQKKRSSEMVKLSGNNIMSSSRKGNYSTNQKETDISFSHEFQHDEMAPIIHEEYDDEEEELEERRDEQFDSPEYDRQHLENENRRHQKHLESQQQQQNRRGVGVNSGAQSLQKRHASNRYQQQLHSNKQQQQQHKKEVADAIFAAEAEASASAPSFRNNSRAAAGGANSRSSSRARSSDRLRAHTHSSSRKQRTNTSNKRSKSTKRRRRNSQKQQEQTALAEGASSMWNTAPDATPLGDSLKPLHASVPMSLDTQTHSDATSMSRIKVSVRMRPPHVHESISPQIHISPLTNQIQLRNKNYRFDHVFGPSTHQETVYTTMASELIADVTRGINATLLAYGQTGAGKTYTTLGSADNGNNKSGSTASGNSKQFKKAFQSGSMGKNSDSDLRSTSSRHASLDGVVPRAIKDLFNRLNEERNEWPNYRVWVSYMQIYMEVIHDLLSSSARTKKQQFLSSSSSNPFQNFTSSGAMTGSGYFSTMGTPTHSAVSTPTNHGSSSTGAGNGAPLGAGLNIREEKGRIYVEGLSKHRVRSFEDVMKILDYGERARMTAQTKLNQESSRSHTLFQIHVERKHSSTGKIIRSTFTCCDLAGSERQSTDHSGDGNASSGTSHTNQLSKVDAHNKSRLFEEARFINLSLSALGNVIHTLQQSKKNAFIPWRDSKLTRVLQPTLSGNSRVSLIVNIGPDDSYIQESLTSLSFGQRAMHVSVKPQINEEVDYKSLALTLQKQLDQLQANKNHEIQQLMEQNQSLEEQLESSHDELEKMQFNFQDAVTEKEKYHNWYQKATDKNLTLMKLLKKRKDRISHLDKFVSIVGEATSPSGKAGDGFSAAGSPTSPADYLSSPSSRNIPAILDKEAQEFIAKERKHFREELLHVKQKNKSLTNKLQLIEKNSSSLNETVGYLTIELEKQNKHTDHYKKRVKSYKKSLAQLTRDLRQLDSILRALSEHQIFGNTNLYNMALSNFSRIFPNRERPESYEGSILFFDAESFSLAPLEVALTTLLDQILEREKTIEVLVQKSRLAYLEDVAHRKIQEQKEEMSELLQEHGNTNGAAPKTPVKTSHKMSSIHTSARKTPSLRNSPQLPLIPHSLKKFQRWNRILDGIGQAKENLPQDSYFSRFDFETHLRASLLASLENDAHPEGDSQDLGEHNSPHRTSNLDPFTQVMINIDNKYSTVKDHLDDLRHKLVDKDLRVSDLETVCNELTQKNQILSRQVRLDQDEKSHMKNQIIKLRIAIQDLEQFSDLSKQNVELGRINRDLEFTNSKLERQLQSVQQKLASGTSIHSTLSSALDDLARSSTRETTSAAKNTAPDLRPNLYNLLYGQDSLTGTPKKDKFSKSLPTQKHKVAPIPTYSDEEVRAHVASLKQNATSLGNVLSPSRTSPPHKVPGRTHQFEDFSRSFGPSLSKPEQQPSMKSLKKRRDITEDRPDSPTELHPYPDSTSAAKWLKHTHGHSTMEKQSPVRKRALITSSDIGNNQERNYPRKNAQNARNTENVSQKGEQKSENFSPEGNEQTQHNDEVQSPWTSLSSIEADKFIGDDTQEAEDSGDALVRNEEAATEDEHRDSSLRDRRRSSGANSNKKTAERRKSLQHSGGDARSETSVSITEEVSVTRLKVESTSSKME